jgi:hypothetical protein
VVPVGIDQGGTRAQQQDLHPLLRDIICSYLYCADIKL